MGMFDKEDNLGETFKDGDRFIICAAEYAGEIHTKHGKAMKSRFQIVSREHPTTKRWYSALGIGFARQAKQAEAGDFPAVVEHVRLPTADGNSVKLLAHVTGTTPREFLDGNDGEPLPVVEDVDALSTDNADAEPVDF